MKTALQLKQSGKSLLGAAAGVALVGVAGAAIGAVCPTCVVAAPALAAAGVVQHLRGYFQTRALETTKATTQPPAT